MTKDAKLSHIMLWFNVNVFPMSNEDDFEIIYDAAIVVEDEKVVWLGPAQELPDRFNQQNAIDIKKYDGKGKCVTPGFIDCHTHLVFAGNRAHELSQRLNGATYTQQNKSGGGINYTVECTRAETHEQLYNSAEKRLQALIAEGVTTCEIKSGYGLDLVSERKILEVARDLGKNMPVDIIKTFLGAHVRPPEFDSNSEYISYITEIMLPELAQAGLVDMVDGFCDSIAFSADELEPLLIKAQQLNRMIKLHAEQLSSCGGAKLAAKYKALSVEHLEYIDEDAIIALKNSKVCAVLLPGAYYFLQAQQKPPINLFRKHDIPMAVATDCNPGSSPCTSILLMLSMACLLFGLTPFEAILGVTRNAAKALGIADKVGTLAPRYQADFIIWDIKHPEELCYNLGYIPGRTVVKKGQVVYES